MSQMAKHSFYDCYSRLLGVLLAWSYLPLYPSFMTANRGNRLYPPERVPQKVLSAYMHCMGSSRLAMLLQVTSLQNQTMYASSMMLLHLESLLPADMQ